MERAPGWGGRIKRLRRELGFERQGKFALALGLVGRDSTVSGWENERVDPGEPVLRAIAALTTDPTRALAWLTDGGEMPPLALQPRFTEKPPTPESRGDGHGFGVEPERVPEGPFDMHNNALKISKAIKEDLEKSAMPVNLKASSALEKQRAMIWAFRDLADKLTALGFDQSRLLGCLFDLGAEAGLPQQDRRRRFPQGERPPDR